jgi:crotonobetainyl-CoA:carnitine CoA-transferase CaiB-like acyl-CoA transferase
MPTPLPRDADPWRPLAGVHVLEIAPYLPGPHAGQLLAELGAAVIKVEPPGGDPARALQAGLYTANNRGKRSVCVDLKSPAAAAVIARLAAWADVVIEGHKPGVAARLGIDDATLRTHQPRLVYAALTGYGQSGPDAKLPGHDINYLAAGGALARSGHWHGPPRRTGLPLADLAGSLHAALGIVAAVHEARATGRGRFLDISLTAAALRLASARGVDAPPRAHLHPTNDLFATRDGQTVAAALIEDHFYARFAAALAADWPDLGATRYATAAARQAAGDSLHALLADVFASRSMQECKAAAHVLPLSPLRDTAGAHAALHAGVPHPPLPFTTDAPAFIAPPAPGVGADTDAVLEDLGFSANDVAGLREAGAIRDAP